MSFNLVVSERMLKAPIAIRRSEKVTVLAKSASFEVRMEGQILADAAIDDKLKVLNLKSKRIIEGKLVSPGTVFIN